jgi:hypothetical protein
MTTATPGAAAGQGAAHAPTVRTLDVSNQTPPKQSLQQLAGADGGPAMGWARFIIAAFLLLLLAAFVGTAITAVFATSVQLDRFKDIFALTFGPVIGLVGTVIGFYFGAQTAQAAAGGNNP